MISNINNNLVLPNFLILGAARAGTTSLYYYLRQHPEVFMSPIKEVNFFAYDISSMEQLTNLSEHDFPIKTITDYQKLFKPGKDSKAIGEASPRYLWHPSAPKKIQQMIPDAKFIVILRNPIQRAFSSYLMYFNQGREKRSFRQAIEEEIQLSQSGKWPLGQMTYVGQGFYTKHLENYFHYFQRDQFQIILYEDYKVDLPGTLHQIFRFLGVSEDVASFDSLPRHNVSGLPKNKVIDFLLKPRKFTKTIRRYIPKKIHDPVFYYFMSVKERNMMKTDMEPHVRRKLIGIYRDDVLKLQNLLARDLSHWLI